MRSFAVLAVVALASQASARTLQSSACQQNAEQIQSLNQQIAATQDQAAACAAGGALQAYNPMWAPWPTHAWPDASSNTCTKMQAHATYIQNNNQAQIAQIQQTSNAQGC